MDSDGSSDKSVLSVANDTNDQPENLVVKTPIIKMTYDDERYPFQEGSNCKQRKLFEETRISLDEDGVEYGHPTTESGEDVAVHVEVESVISSTRAHDFFEMINESHGRCLLCNREIRRKKYNFQMHLQHRHPHILQGIVSTASVTKRRAIKPVPAPVVASVPVPAKKEDSAAVSATNKLNDALCTWVCADLIPLHQIESEHFRRFVWMLNDGYDLHPPTFTDVWLPEFEKKIGFGIVQDIQSGGMGTAVSLCLDTWTCTKSKRPCLVLMANYIDKEWSQRTCCLGAALLDKRHVFYSILGKITDSLKKYSIKRVHSVATNGHPDVARACEQLSVVHYVCIAHQLQSLLLPLLHDGLEPEVAPVGDDNQSTTCRSLKNLVQVVDKTRQISKLMIESPSLWEHYCYLFENMQWQAPCAIPTDVPGRWNSTVPMLREVLKQVEFLRMASSQLHYEELFVTEAEKSLLLDLVELLEPFEEAVGALGSRAFPVASMIIPVIGGIKARLKEMLNDALEKKKPDFFSVCTWVMDKMAAASATYEKNLQLQVATFLDPRFKGFCLDEDEENLVVKQITDEMDALLHADFAAVNPATEQNPRSIFGCLFKSSSDKAPAAEPDSLDYQEVRAIVCTYAKLQRLPMEADVFNYWNDKEQQKSFSILPSIARKYLGFVATASNSKYAFTKKGDLLKERCSNLSVKYAESLLFTNQNKRYF